MGAVSKVHNSTSFRYAVDLYCTDFPLCLCEHIKLVQNITESHTFETTHTAEVRNRTIF